MGSSTTSIGGTRARFIGASLIIATALAACGGGGDGGSAPPVVVAPPTTAATLVASGAEAQAATRAGVEAAAKAVELSASLGQSIVPLAQGGSPLTFAGALGRAPMREQAQARETVACADFVALPCSGSVTIDSNLADTATVATPGSYIAVTFEALRATPMGMPPLSLDGTLRIDFLTSFALDATSVANQRLQLSFDGLRGSDEGISFGPLTLQALVEFDAAGNATTTMDGMRVRGLDTISVTDALNYALGSVSLRRAAWTSGTDYVDFDFAGWSVAVGRPALGSRLTVSAGGNSVLIVVTASGASQVVYRASFTVGGIQTRYDVSASYPQGGGAPTYVAVAVGG